MLRMFGVSLVCGLCVIAAGCGSDIATVSVSGTVTVDGEPLEGAQVVFSPIEPARDGSAVASNGTTDADGRYTLMVTLTEQKGAVVGKHYVSISKFAEEEDEDSDELPEDVPDPVPPHDDLTFDVLSSGTDQANFPLSFSGSTESSSTPSDE
jgi:hypothetical protein